MTCDDSVTSPHVRRIRELEAERDSWSAITVTMQDRAEKTEAELDNVRKILAEAEAYWEHRAEAAEARVAKQTRKERADNEVARKALGYPDGYEWREYPMVVVAYEYHLLVARVAELERMLFGGLTEPEWWELAVRVHEAREKEED